MEENITNLIVMLNSVSTFQTMLDIFKLTYLVRGGGEGGWGLL